MNTLHLLEMIEKVHQDVQSKTNRLVRCIHSNPNGIGFRSGQVSILIGRDVTISIEILRLFRESSPTGRHKITLRATGVKSRYIKEVKAGGFRIETITKNILEMADLTAKYRKMIREQSKKKTQFMEILARLNAMAPEGVTVGINQHYETFRISINGLDETMTEYYLSNLSRITPPPIKEDVSIWDHLKE